MSYYRPDLIGPSYGSHLAELPYTVSKFTLRPSVGQLSSHLQSYYVNDVLNGAQSNAGVDTLGFQVEYPFLRFLLYILNIIFTSPRGFKETQA